MEAYLQKLSEKSFEPNTNEDKNCIICNFYDFSQTYPQQNDVIRMYTEQVVLYILFLATKTHHRVTKVASGSETCIEFDLLSL